ncbi:MAG: murein biosynthesis integral membrane protein MurJ [Acidimicrobiia bacterium]
MDEVRSVPPRLLRESASGALGASVALGVGLVLDLLLAFLFGAGSETDALFVALRIPFGVAVFFPPTAIQVVLPLVSRWLDEDNRRTTNARTSAALLATLAVTSAVAIAGILAAPLLTRLLAPGLDEVSSLLATKLTRIAFLIIPPLATSEVLKAYRHAHRAHGWASALHGVVGLAVVVTLLMSPKANVELATWAFVMGALGQLAGAWLLARASGFKLVLGYFLTPETKALGSLALRPLGASAIQPGAKAAEQIVASLLAPGSITILTYGNRLVSAVGGTLFFRPVMTAFLGPMSLAHARSDIEQTRTLLLKGLQIMLTISAAITVIVAVAGAPLVAGVFSFGSFGASQAELLGIVVAFYAASLPGAALQRMLLGFSFARLDTSTYLRNTYYGAAANFVLLGVMFFVWRTPLAILMVPIAYGMAQVVNVWHAAWAVRRDFEPAFAGLKAVIARLAVVSAWALIVMVLIRMWLSPDLNATPRELILAGLASAAAGAAGFAIGWLVAFPVEARDFAAKRRQLFSESS